MTNEEQTIADQTETNEPAFELAKLLMRASREPALRARLLADARSTLVEEGLTVADGMVLNVVENTSERIHFVLPVQPTNLSDEELEQVAGGGRIMDRIVENNKRMFEYFVNTFLRK